jgi:carbamoyl-phosphate synthase/aspartate carbamoyltransferase
MVGLEVEPYKFSLLDIDYVCVKAPMFSFTRLRGADPSLGVEMASTGEVACFGEDQNQAFMQALLSTNFKLPSNNHSILLSIATEQKRFEFAESVLTLVKLNKYKLYATPGTAQYYKDHHNLDFVVVQKSTDESDDGPGTAVYEIKQSKIDLVINVSDGTGRKDEITSGYLIRRASVDFGTSLITNVKCAIELVQCLDRGLDKKGAFIPRHIQEYYTIPSVGWTLKL